MTIQKILSSLFLLFLSPGILMADSVRISQVDSNALLLKQQIRLYVSVTDNRGAPVKGLRQSDFKITEAPEHLPGGIEREIQGFQEGINYSEGVSFLLLVDNSESMYWTLEGDKTNNNANRRITVAKRAVIKFLESVKNPEDQVGVVAYNSGYTLLSELSTDMEMVKQQLESLQRPKGDAIYSEIYASLSLAVDEIGIARGRKAVIILSDGVNNPAFNHTGKMNEQFGAKNIPYEAPLNKLQMEGISLYVINFGAKNDKKDRHLNTIASQSGGVTFDAHNQNELNQVYREIMNQVHAEYALTYRATMEPADLKRVQVSYKKGNRMVEGSRTYLSGSVFGVPTKPFGFFSPLFILIAAGLLWWLSKMKFEKRLPRPSIEILRPGAGKLSRKVVPLNTDKTVIGSSTQADLTIADMPAIEENHATIVFDPSSKKYALKGAGKIMVNNQRVTTKVLEPGDFINIDGVTMFFDEGFEEEEGATEVKKT